MRYAFALALGIGGIIILLWLGLWQLQRLDWKEGVLAEIEAKIDAAPIALPLAPTKQDHNRISVELEATIGFDEAHVLTSKKLVGPGYLVIAPALESRNKRKILIDMGFIPEAEKDAIRAPARIKVVGNMLWPNETDSFTPEPNLERNIWFARDLEKMAAHFDTENVLVVAREVSGEPFATEPVAIGHDIPNDHLEYAITWFSLALVWLGMTLFLLWRIKQKTV